MKEFELPKITRREYLWRSSLSLMTESKQSKK